MRRRKRRPNHSNHERWLVSYADFITLLFAFFVVLYASSQVDKKKSESWLLRFRPLSRRWESFRDPLQHLSMS
jgi:chemotaxis protein MotB